jgi:hypothetical protein
MKLVKRSAWILVAAVALGLSNWSLAYVARSWGVPWVLSLPVSAVFDGVALISAGLALRAARNGDSTFGPGSCLVVFGGASAWFNSWHAHLAGYPVSAAVFYAFPPLAALVVTELELRADRREALRAAGRIADPLPAFGGATWANLPWPAYQGWRKVMRYRLDEKIDAETKRPVQRVAGAAGKQGAGPARQLPHRKPAGHGQRTRLNEAEMARLVEWVKADKAEGLPVSKRKVAARHDVSEHHAQRAVELAGLNGSAAA